MSRARRPRPARPPSRPVVVDRPPNVCQYGNPQCGAIPARFYPCGWKCDDHQPAKTSRRTTP